MTEDLRVEFVDAVRRNPVRGVMVGEIEMYCRNSDCVAREVRVWVKFHGTEPIPQSADCPLCGSALTLHGVKTRSEIGV